MPEPTRFRQNYKQAQYAVEQAKQAVQNGKFHELERYKTHLAIVKKQLHKQLQDQPEKVISSVREEHQQALNDIAQAEHAIQQALLLDVNDSSPLIE